MGASLDRLVAALTDIIARPATIESAETHSAITAAVKDLRAGVARLRLGVAA